MKDTKREEEYLNGLMDKYMMVNGKEGKRMEVECGKALMEIHTLESGKREKLKALESLFQRMVIVMKDSLKNQ